MKTIKNKESDTDKALAKVGNVSKEDVKVENQIDAFSDSSMTEKDEVKAAEERMRQLQRKRQGKNNKYTPAGAGISRKKTNIYGKM